MKIRSLSLIMVLCFVGVNALFLTAVSVFSYRIYSQITYEEVSDGRLALLNETVNQVSTYMKGISDYTLYTVSNELVISSLSEQPASSFDAVNKQRVLAAFLNQASAVNKDTYSLEIFTDRFEAFPKSPDTGIFPIQAIRDQDWFALLEQSDGVWVPKHHIVKDQIEVVSYVHRIHNPKGQTTGFVKINVPADKVLVNKNRSNSPHQLLLLDADGRIIVTRTVGDPTNSWTDFPNIDTLPELTRHKEQSNYYEVIEQQSSQYLAIISTPSQEQWKLMQLVPVDVLLSKTKRVGYYVTIVGLVGLLLSVPLAFWIVRLMVMPISKIIAGMRMVEKGNFDVRVKEFSIDEYAILSSSFNKMAFRLNELLQNLTMEHRKKREAELQLLQSQIKPHFLYNTLDMIYWRALDYKADDIGLMINQLGKLFRIGLSGGHLYIQLRDELEHVKCYMRIQKARLQKSIQYTEDVPTSLMGHYVPKIILQPFIENSITHGFTKNGASQIEIFIAIQLVSKDHYEYLEVTIQDNGRGYQGNYDFTSFTGIGIRNVHERIQIYCGDEYGVTLSDVSGNGNSSDSSIGSGDEAVSGAVAKIRLPVIPNESAFALILEGHA